MQKPETSRDTYKSLADQAYFHISQALDFDQQGDKPKAIDFYKTGIFKLKSVLSLTQSMMQ